MVARPICPQCQSFDVVAPNVGDVAGCQSCNYFGPTQHFFAHAVRQDNEPEPPIEALQNSGMC